MVRQIGLLAILILAAFVTTSATSRSQTLIKPSKIVSIRNVSMIDVSSDGSAVIARDFPGNLVCLDSNLNDAKVAPFSSSGPSISISGNGSQVVTVGLTKMRVWNRRTGSLLYTISSPIEFYESAGFTGSANILAAAINVWPASKKSRENITLFRADNGDRINRYWLPRHEASFDTSKDGEQVAVGCWGETVWLLNCETGSTHAIRVSNDSAPISFIKLSYDGKWLIACSDTGLCYVMPTRTLRLAAVLNVKNYIWAAAFCSNDGKVAILPVASNAIEIYSRKKGTKLASVTTVPGPPTTFAYSGANDKLYVTDGGRGVSIIDNFSKAVASAK